MRFASTCPICLSDAALKFNRRAAPQGGEYFQMPLSSVGVGEVGEDFVVVCECGHGHKFRILTHSYQDFEFLCRVAVDAFTSGFFDETVMDLMAATERAYEYFCQVACYSRGMKFEAIDAAWKGLGKLSERRLGWFSAIWLLETGKPYVVPKKIVELRNDTIHNGQLPSRSQTLKFADWAIEVMFDISILLRTAHGESMVAHGRHYVAARRERLIAKAEQNPATRGLMDSSFHASSVFGLDWGSNYCPYSRLSFTEFVEKVGVSNLHGLNPKVKFMSGAAVDFHPPKAAK